MVCDQMPFFDPVDSGLLQRFASRQPSGKVPRHFGRGDCSETRGREIGLLAPGLGLPLKHQDVAGWRFFSANDRAEAGKRRPREDFNVN